MIASRLRTAPSYSFAPISSANSFRLIRFRKNASANPLLSHGYKKGVGGGGGGPARGSRPQVPGQKEGARREFDAALPFLPSTVDRQLFLLSPLSSTLTQEWHQKPFRINTYEKEVGGTPLFYWTPGLQAIGDSDCSGLHQSPVTNHQSPNHQSRIRSHQSQVTDHVSPPTPNCGDEASPFRVNWHT